MSAARRIVESFRPALRPFGTVFALGLLSWTRLATSDQRARARTREDLRRALKRG